MKILLLFLKFVRGSSLWVTVLLIPATEGIMLFTALESLESI